MGAENLEPVRVEVRIDAPQDLKEAARANSSESSKKGGDGILGKAFDNLKKVQDQAVADSAEARDRELQIQLKTDIFVNTMYDLDNQAYAKTPEVMEALNTYEPALQNAVRYMNGTPKDAIKAAIATNFGNDKSGEAFRGMLTRLLTAVKKANFDQLNPKDFREGIPQSIAQQLQQKGSDGETLASR